MTPTPTAHEIAMALDADGAVILNNEGSELTAAEVWPANDAVAPMLSITVGFGVTGLVARNGKPMLLDDDSPRNATHRRLLGLKPGVSVARMCLPAPGLFGVVAGVVALHRAPSHPFDRRDLARATPLAEHVGLSLHAHQLWRSVHRHRSERDRLIEAAISAQEAERRRIAFDLHDGVTTTLASMSFHLSAADLALGRLPVETAPQALHAISSQVTAARKLADLAYHGTRTAISGLHSLVLDDLGLVAALETLVQSTMRADTQEIDLVTDSDADFTTLPDHKAAALYRIAQEGLANAVKHAQAQRIVISLRRVGDSVVLGCADDGVGFTPRTKREARAAEQGVPHYGLSSIAERCALIEASLRIESMPGRGTTVLVELPL